MKLKSAIEFLGKSYTEVKFREPRGVDIASCGSVAKMGAVIKSGNGDENAKSGGTRIDAESVHNLMIACSDVPREVIDMLKPADWTAGMIEIMGFFGDMVPETDS